MPRPKKYKQERKGTCIMVSLYEKELVSEFIVPASGRNETLTSFVSHAIRNEAAEIVRKAPVARALLIELLEKHGVSEEVFFSELKPWVR